MSLCIGITEPTRSLNADQCCAFKIVIDAIIAFAAKDTVSPLEEIGCNGTDQIFTLSIGFY